MWSGGRFRFIERGEEWMRLRWLLTVILVKVRTCLLKKHHLVVYTNS